MPNAERLLTVKEVATILKLNTLTVYAYIRKRQLPAVKFGRNYRIESKDLAKFIKEHHLSPKNK